MKFLLKRPVAFLYLIIIILMASAVKFSSMPISLYPNASQPTINIRSWDGHLDHEVYREKYGKNFVDTLLGNPEVISVKSEYSSGYRKWSVEFDWNISLDEAKSIATNAVNNLNSILPDDLNNLRINIEGGRSSRVLVSLNSATVPGDKIYEFAKRNIEPKLRSLNGAGSVWTSSVERKNIKVTASYAKMLKFDISPFHLRKILSEKNNITALGEYENNVTGDYKTFQISDPVDTIDDIKNKVLKVSKGKNVLVRDVAEVKVANQKLDRIYKGNGKRGIILSVSPVLDANISEFSNSVIDVIKNESAKINNLNYTVLTNPAKFIEASIENVTMSVLVGVLIATFVIFLFFRSLASTFIIASSIPLSLAGGVLLMAMFGVQINLISLGAMALSVGMVVDGAVVVFENIVRVAEGSFRDLRDTSSAEKFKWFKKCTLEGTRQVVVPVFISILTTIVVFVPLLFTSPMANAILGDLAAVISLVLLFSILVASFYVPLVTIYFFKFKKEQSQNIRIFDRVFESIKSIYLKTLSKLLSSTKLSIVTVVSMTALVAASLIILKLYVKKEIIPPPASNIILISLVNKTGITDVEKLNQKIMPIEKRIENIVGDKLDGYESIISTNWTGFFVKLKSSSDLNTYKDLISKEFVTNLEFSFNVKNWSPTKLRIPDPPDMIIDLPGDLLKEDRANFYKAISDKFKSSKGFSIEDSMSRNDFFTTEVTFNNRFESLSSEKKIFLKREIPALIAAMNRPETVSTIEYNNFETKVELEYDVHNNKNFSYGDLHLKVDSKYVPIRTYVDFVPKKANSFAAFLNDKELNRFEIRFDEENFDKVKSEILKIAGDKLSTLSFIDGQLEIEKNLESLYLAFVIAILAVLFVILVQFSGVLDSLVVLSAIPLGLFGASMALLGFGETLSMNSLLGIILLAGIGVNNSIIFLDFFKNELKNNSNTLSEKIITTANIRFRPIIITTLTTMIGMLPIAIGFGEGGDVLKSLGLVIFFGLGWSTLCTMIFMPLVLSYMYRRKFKAIN